MEVFWIYFMVHHSLMLRIRYKILCIENKKNILEKSENISGYKSAISTKHNPYNTQK
jgi:hypothetical protein